MANEELKPLIAQGLAAMKAGGEIASGATQEIENDASDPELKQALQQGSRTSRQWAERIDRALDGVGDGQERRDNPVIQAHTEVAARIRREAPDPKSRDLGIVASGQLALHYWIAAFGTMRAYLSASGNEQAAGDMQKCLDEAKRADEQHNQIAYKLMGTEQEQGADQNFMLSA